MRRQIPQLDGLRTIAVLLVIADHTLLLASGYVGVDIFFVLSGYLITTILVEQRSSGRWNIRAFYVRRMRRLFPALALMLLLTLPVDGLFLDGTPAHRLAATMLSATYLSDFAAAVNVNWLSGFAHTWSLAVEEQFYLVWPLALPWVITRRHGPRALFAAAAAMLIALSFGPGGWMFLPVTRGGILLIGCLLALWLPGRRVHRAVAPLSLALLILAIVIAPTPDHLAPHAGAASTLVGVATAGLIAGTLNGGWLARALSWGPLVWTGKRSYGIYLWQLPIALTLLFAGYDHTLAVVVITTAASIVVAALSYRFVEQRIWRRSADAATSDSRPAIPAGVAIVEGDARAG